MKGKLVLTAILLMYIAAVNATVYTWPYNFGTGTGSFATSNTSSTTFMPQPSAVPVSGGEDYVYCSNVGGGGLFLENPGLPTIGSATELRLQASTNASPNKFSIYNNTNNLDDQSSYHSFSIQFGNAAGGNVTTAGGAFYFFVGKGVMYTSDAAYANAQIFTGIRWVLGATGTITATYSTNSGWNALAGITFVQGRKYDIAVYANNKASGNTYTRNGTGYSLANNKWDLWVDNVRIAAALANTQLGGSVFLDSFLFSGDTATGNNACAFIDDIIYMNSCTGTVTIDPTEYYATPTGNLNLTTSWVTNVDGIGGSNPPNFTSGYQTFHIQNNAAPTIGANWVVSGTSTNVILGDGTNAVTFTIPSAFTMTGPINVQNNVL
ncbi:MAG: hypothetical protein Q8J62_08825 [Candidatus Cloacimonadaceae bacterium]|nr:hypothetical protein [Candidatus Cloacimonadaceae bacterium]